MASIPLPPVDHLRGFFPPKDSNPYDILAFRNRQISPWNAVRVGQMQRVSVALNYTLGNQDLELDRATLVANSRGYTFRQRSSNHLPGKDNNKISAPVEVEIASILKRQWIPKVPSSSPDPRVQAAAQVSEGVLLYLLDSGSWPEVRFDNTFNFVVTGTSFLVSYYDELYTELHSIGSPTGVYCQECESPYYSKQIPRSASEMVQQGSDSLQAVSGNEDALEMRQCPQCGGALSENLSGFEPNEGMTDFLGRPIMLSVPKGKPSFDADIAFEVYPENSGIRVSPRNMRRFARRKVRSLDWLEERIPNAIDDYGVMPESPQDLLHQNPMLGDWGTLGRYNYAYDAGVLDHHVNVDEMIELPTIRNPLGRYVMMVKDEVLRDDDLLMKGEIGGETVWAPRMQMSIARYRLRPGEIYGAGLPDGVISKQNRYNTIMAQHAQIRGTLGAPKILAPQGLNLTGPEYIRGYGASVMRFEPDLTAPEKFYAPTIFPGVAFPSESYKELEILDRDIKEEVGPQEIDYGAAPKNITTTSGLQILGENSQTRRDPREVEFFNSLSKMWSHLLQMEWTRRTDEAMYEVAGPNNTWAVKKYTQLDLCGLTKVKAEKQAFAEKSIVIREAIREAQVDGLIDISSPVVRKKVLESRGLPTDLNEDSCLQVMRAEQQWVDFIDEGSVFVIDETLDNGAIRWHVHGLHLQRDEGVDLEKAVRWPEILKAISGWQDDLQGLLELDAMQFQAYGVHIGSPEDVQGVAESYAQKVLDFKSQRVEFDKETQAGAEIAKKGGQPPPGAPPPEAPIEPRPVPAMLQDKIFATWTARIQKVPELAQAIEQPVPFNETEQGIVPLEFLRFRAGIEAYRWMALNPTPLTPPGSGATGVSGDQGSMPLAPPGQPSAGPGQPPPPPGAAPQTNSLPEGGRTTGRLS